MSTRPAKPESSSQKSVVRSQKAASGEVVQLSPDAQQIPLDMIKDQIRVEWDAYTHSKRESTRREIRLGLLLIIAQARIEHGNFVPWLEANSPVKLRQSYRFIKVAKLFIARAQLPAENVLLLSDGQGGTAKQQQHLQQLLLDFVGDRSQAELFAEYGVVNKGKAPALHQSAGNQTLHHQNRFNDAICELDRLTKGTRDTDMRWLEPNQVVAAYTHLEEIAQRLRGEIKRRQNDIKI